MKLTFVILAVFLFSTSLLQSGLGEKILSIAFFSSKSHKLTYLPLLEELGKRGHEVTILSPIKATKEMKNVKEHLTIDWDEIQQKMLEDDKFNPFNMKEKQQGMNPFTLMGMFIDLCKSSYDLPIVNEILKEKFDLVFMQPIFNECALALVYKMNASLVLFTPISAPEMIVHKVGGHLPPSIHSNVFLEYSGEMNFYRRFINFGFNILFDLVNIFYYEPKMEAFYRDRLGEDVPSIRQILGNASLVLSNGHFTLHGPKPFLPDVVEVGGLHSFVPAKPVPKEIEDFIKKGNDGFIFFSMGSAIKGSAMPEAKRKMFINVFSKLKQQVLWKWETETMPDLPKNVKLSKWLPQQDLLARKDIKMFITHCGGGSTEESIYNGVPLIGFPMMGDQLANAKQAKGYDMIVELEWNNFTEEELTNAINEVLNNPKYLENAKKISALFSDQPDNPLTRAVYWIEYVLRHKGAPHLRSVGRKLNYFQYHSYDVILTYIGIISLTLYLLFSTLRWVVRKICCRSSSSSNKGNKSKKE